MFNPHIQKNTIRSDNELLYAAINPEPHFKPKEKESFSFKFKRFKDSEIFRYWPLLLILLAFWLGNHFAIVINQTDSLPQKVWLMALDQKPKRYDYVAFKPALKSDLPMGIILHKQVLGVAGDVVSLKGRDFYINGEFVATAKTHSLTGEPLTLGATGTLKEGQYYVSTPHKDSFDSRYEKMGWINAGELLGVLYPLW
jgi:conjugal transfer pilin signal peptidase TrbI